MNLINAKGCDQFSHKFVLLLDKSEESKPFYEENNNSYPFSIDTVIFSYYFVYKKYYSTPTIQ